MIKKLIKRKLNYFKRPKCPNIPKYHCTEDCIHCEWHWEDYKGHKDPNGLVFRGISCRINAR